MTTQAEVVRSTLTFEKDIIVKIEEHLSELSSTHAFHIWPSAIVMSCYLMHELRHHEKQEDGHDKPRCLVCELGCGCAVPGILTAKMGHGVILTDYPHPDEPAWRRRILEQCRLNAVQELCQILPLKWGQFDKNLMHISEQNIDYIIGSDCFYDLELFEPLIVTAAYLLSQYSKEKSFNSGDTRHKACKFVTTYHERVETYNIRHLLNKWHLEAQTMKTSDYITPELYKQIYQSDYDSKYQEAIHSIRIIVIALKEN